ncbi:unnamed protein product, partial [Ectocarpus sp. 12 AP-2014]
RESLEDFVPLPLSPSTVGRFIERGNESRSVPGHFALGWFNYPTSPFRVDVRGKVKVITPTLRTVEPNNGYQCNCLLNRTKTPLERCFSTTLLRGLKLVTAWFTLPCTSKYPHPPA